MNHFEKIKIYLCLWCGRCAGVTQMKSAWLQVVQVPNLQI